MTEPSISEAGSSSSAQRPMRIEAAAVALMAVGLLAVLAMHLLLALLAGLSAYALHRALESALARRM